MSSVKVQTLIPHQAVYPNPKSTSKHILRRRQVEILPLETTSFTYEGNDSIKFNISSSSEMLDGLQSYIKMDFLLDQTNAEGFEYLCEGGCHGLFKEIELRSQNGTRIQKYDLYNRWYAIVSNATHSPHHIELVESAAGDSMCGSAYVNSIKPCGYYNSVLTAGGTLTAADPAVYTLGDATQEYFVKAGDRITLINGDAAATSMFIGTVASSDGAGVITFEESNANGLPFADIVSAVFQSATDYVPQRARVARSATKVALQWKPAVSFLQYQNWIPLAFIKQGLQLELRLDRPQHVISKGLPVSAQNGSAVSYTISDPRYVANLVTVDESIMSDFLSMYNGDGIHMSILGYAHDRRTFSNTAVNMNANPHFGVRSARHVLAICQSSRLSEATGRAAQGVDSISLFLDGGIDKYQFKSGSEEFPQREVKAYEDNVFATEAFQQLMYSMGQMGSTLWSVRMSPDEWRQENRVLSATTDTSSDVSVISDAATKFIMSTRLDRNDDNFTGLDLSLNALDFESSCQAVSSAYGDRILHFFVAYDILISLSSQGLRVRK